MATIRWYRSQTADPVTPSKIRWYSSSTAGALPTATKIRWYSSSTSGSVKVVLVAPEARITEPNTPQSVIAQVASGAATPSTYTFRVISGNVTLSGTGSTRTFKAPAGDRGAQADIGIVGTLAGVASDEVVLHIETLPQLLFTLDTPSRAIGPIQRL